MSATPGLHPWANHSANVRCDASSCCLCHAHQFTGCGEIMPSARCSCGVTYGEFLAVAASGDAT